ncbi:fimbrial protein [Stenotrophomonas sp.]|uniref:fimbrial protein n=1 Tax=Stenotrophomonas sp. TaxID=69392 RepID=UPI0028A8C722|nr:fimbrial protein [Stenotrophomonas sp.]
MNIHLSRISLCAVALAGLAIIPSALADTATITVSGRVLPGTCTMANATIALDDIEAADVSLGQASGLKPGTLNFTGCVGVTTIDLSFDGTGDAAQDDHWQNGASSDAASGVAVALLDGPTGTTYLRKGDSKSVIVAGASSARLDLRAGYYRKSGTLMSAGAVSTQITVTADYK